MFQPKSIGTARTLSYAGCRTLHCLTENGLLTRDRAGSGWLLQAVLVASLVACTEPDSPSTPVLSEASATGNGQTVPPSTQSPPSFVQLSGDALTAPLQPNLIVSAVSGYLNFSWEPVDGQTSASVIHHDPNTGTQTLIDLSPDPDARSLSIPAQTHLRAWHREQFHVELCSGTECITSQRTGIVGLAESSFQTLTPSVFVEQERFAEHMDVNKDASLMVASLPLAGAVQLYLRVGDQWIAGQFIRLDDLPASSQRQLHVSLSSSGDTLAVAVVDSSEPGTHELRMFERLGESWIETARWRTDSSSSVSAVDDVSVVADNVTDLAIQLTDDGDHLVVAEAQRVAVYRRLSSGWSTAIPLTRHGNTITSPPYSARFGQDALNLSIATSANADTIVTADVLDATIWLSVWHKRNNGPDGIEWYKAYAFPTNDLDPERDVRVMSNLDGSRIAIAGWESSGGQTDTPVLWRYSITTDAMAAGVSSSGVMMVTDSLRLGPSVQTQASLRFDADNDLTTIVIGWQGEAFSASGNDAALSTYQYDNMLQEWISRLELPEAVPTLARNAFAGVVRLSGDGATLLIASAAGQGQTATNENRVGRILALQ